MKSGLRILIRAPEVPFSVPPNSQKHPFPKDFFNFGNSGDLWSVWAVLAHLTLLGPAEHFWTDSGRMRISVISHVDHLSETVHYASIPIEKLH